MGYNLLFVVTVLYSNNVASNVLLLQIGNGLLGKPDYSYASIWESPDLPMRRKCCEIVNGISICFYMGVTRFTNETQML